MASPWDQDHEIQDTPSLVTVANGVDRVTSEPGGKARVISEFGEGKAAIDDTHAEVTIVRDGQLLLPSEVAAADFDVYFDPASKVAECMAVSLVDGLKSAIG